MAVIQLSVQGAVFIETPETISFYPFPVILRLFYFVLCQHFFFVIKLNIGYSVARKKWHNKFYGFFIFFIVIQFYANALKQVFDGKLFSYDSRKTFQRNRNELKRRLTSFIYVFL